MDQIQLFSLLLLVVLVVPLSFILQRRQLFKRGGWYYKNEIVPGLGKVQALYEGDKLSSYEFKKDGVNFSVNCRFPESVPSAIEEAQSFTPAKIEQHLQQAIKVIPKDEMDAWGFNKGKWEMERIFINAKGYLILELGNSHDRDHCCRIIFENKEYEFECVDG